MGLFGDKLKEITSQQGAKLNSLLPKQLQKEKWFPNDFKGDDSIFKRLVNLKDNNNETIKFKENELAEFQGTQFKVFKQKLLDDLSSKIIIFNTDLYEAKPLGMVDIGAVEKFGVASTGNRFENGVIGYAIEQSFDNVWANNNAQESSLNKVKADFLKKAKLAYPDCNMIFKYDVDFRELGSSGNVFIYIRGTASIGKNSLMDEAIKENEKRIKLRSVKCDEKEKEIKELNETQIFILNNIDNVPKKLSEVETKLN